MSAEETTRDDSNASEVQTDDTSNFYDGSEPFFAMFSQAQVDLGTVRLTLDDRVAFPTSDLRGAMETARRSFQHSGDVNMALQDVARIAGQFDSRAQSWSAAVQARESDKRGQSGSAIAKMKSEASRVRNKISISRRTLSKLEIQLNQMSADEVPEGVPESVPEDAGDETVPKAIADNAQESTVPSSTVPSSAVTSAAELVESEFVESEATQDTAELEAETKTVFPPVKTGTVDEPAGRGAISSETIRGDAEARTHKYLKKLIGTELRLTFARASRPVTSAPTGREQAWEKGLPILLVAGWQMSVDEFSGEDSIRVRFWIIPKTQKMADELAVDADQIRLSLQPERQEPSTLRFAVLQRGDGSLPRSTSIRDFIAKIQSERFADRDNSRFTVLTATFDNVKHIKTELVLTCE